ncbi:MAG: hypothetical protein ACOH2V_14410, partial [Candidatus Saccharimonadaceae bacterium]
KSTTVQHTKKINDLKIVLTPHQFLAQIPDSSRMQISRTIAANYINDYMRYRIEFSQHKTNKYAESIGVLKSTISLLNNNHQLAAAIVLINSGFDAHELTTRVSGIVEYAHYKTPKRLTLFIRHTLDGVKDRQHYIPVKNTENNYVMLDGNPCPVVYLEDDLTVLCPFCLNRHKHRQRGKHPDNKNLPDGHFQLPCLTSNNAPLQMFDDTICHPRHGYFISNYENITSIETSPNPISNETR